MTVNEQTTLEEVLRQPWLAGWEYMVDPGLDPLLLDMMGEEGYQELFQGKCFSQFPLGEVQRVFPAWIASSVISGLNFLQKKASQGTVFCHIWNEEERKADPSNELTGLSAFPGDGSKPFFLICPGGGYCSVCTIAEGFPVAERLNELGYGAYILQYRIGEHASERHPLEDASAAVRFLLKHKETFGIRNENYYMTGFSAGGHLAGMFGTAGEGAAAFAVPGPAGIALGYPVVTMGENTHEGSRRFFLGENADAGSAARFSLEKQITPEYPPAFIWQCEEDDTVPSVNSRMLAEALEAQGVKHCLEIFAGSAHGWGLGNGTASEGWLERAADFLNRSCLTA